MQKIANGKTPMSSRDLLSIYDAYYKEVYNRVYYLVGNRMDAEDITQDAFLIARDKASQLKDIEKTKGWIMMIARNKALNYLKRTPLNLDVEDLEIEPDLPEEEDPWKGFSTSNILQAISELPDGYRAVISLYLLEDLSHDEIASELGISTSASRSQYSRGKRILQDKLLAYYGQA